MPRLTGTQYEALTRALVSAFPNLDALDAMVQFKLGVSREAEIASDAMVATVVLEVIRWAEARGPRLNDLVVGALNQNPHNTDLQAVAVSLGLDEGAGQFERIVREHIQFEDVESWRARMMASERAVCRVEIGGEGIGTGFLVGPSLAITNYHVMVSVIEEQAKPADVKLHFDYKLTADGKQVQEGARYGLAPGTGWLAAKSPVAALDYALLRVEGTPAEGQVASQPGAPQRGFLSPQAYDFKAGDPLFIIQHPKASPLKFAPGSVDAPNVAPNRVAYTVNTEGGSSGSPCFTSDWTVVALHHWGGDQHNRGVVFAPILADWTAQGVAAGG